MWGVIVSYAYELTKMWKQIVLYICNSVPSAQRCKTRPGFVLFFSITTPGLCIILLQFNNHFPLPLLAHTVNKHMKLFPFPMSCQLHNLFKLVLVVSLAALLIKAVDCPCVYIGPDPLGTKHCLYEYIDFFFFFFCIILLINLMPMDSNSFSPSFSFVTKNYMANSVKVEERCFIF